MVGHEAVAQGILRRALGFQAQQRLSPRLPLGIRPGDVVRLDQQTGPFERLRAPVEHLPVGHRKGGRRRFLEPCPKVVRQILDPLAALLLGLLGRGQDAALGEVNLRVVNASNRR